MSEKPSILDGFFLSLTFLKRLRFFNRPNLLVFVIILKVIWPISSRTGRCVFDFDIREQVPNHRIRPASSLQPALVVIKFLIFCHSVNIPKKRYNNGIMKQYYSLVARGQTTKTEHGKSFFGMNGFLSVEAENRVQAFQKIYAHLSEETSDITAVRPDGEKYLLGFSADEWNEVSDLKDVRISEGYPEQEGIQIQGIRDVPYC
jgi:hypothetical protein